MTTAPAPQRPLPKKPARSRRVLFSIVAAAALVFATPIVLRVFVYEAFEMDGPSMEPTLWEGDRFVVNRAAYGLFLPFAREAAVSWGEPEVGEVVVLRSPYDDIDIVKRILGVRGDRIEIRDDVVYRNGESILVRARGACASSDDDTCVESEERVGERTWRTHRSSLSMSDSMPEVVVPDGHVFVLGDHRDRSNDSRNPRVGMVPVGRIKGPIAFSYYRR